ncbi:MAG: hypothetical protein QGF77_06215, partial [Candidatus Thalassarchaeaceae archaeon]|nr:hypothetical protein [Candidatus Thalassarchaeaceae archaeon]
NQSSGDGEFTVYPLAYEGANDSVTLHLPEASPPEIGTQSFDENLIPLIFAVNTTNWSEPCPSASSLMVLNKMGPQDYNPSFVGSPTGCDLNYTDFHYEFTFFVGLDDRENDSVSLYLPEQGNYFLGTQTINENMTPLIFPVNTNNWDENHCAQEIRIAITDQGSDWYYPDYTQWGQPPICPKMTYYIHYETTFGSIDYDTGYGEIYLDEPLEEKELEVEYWSYTEGMEFGDFVECLAPLFSFALFVVWIIQIVRAFQAGLTTQGTGMLVGIIPAFFVSLILTFVIGIILFGF